MDDTATKRCTKCGETKPLTEFYLRSAKDPNGPRRSICKVCAAKGAASRQKRGPSIITQIMRHAVDKSYQLSPEAEAALYPDKPLNPEAVAAYKKRLKRDREYKRRLEREAEKGRSLRPMRFAKWNGGDL